MERISALMDGELHGDEVVGAVGFAKAQNQVREAWHTYHLIGDVLRGERCSDVQLMSSFAERLAQEPTVLAPQRRRFTESARRYALPSLAAAAAVTAVTWMSLETQQGPVSPGFSAIAEAVLPTATLPQPTAITHLVQPASLSSPPAAILFPARSIDAYLQAHHEFSPSRTIQGLTSYARTVTTDTAESGR